MSQSTLKSNNPRPHSAKTAGEGERLQKVLAGAGLGSRRECEELIVEGRVEVDHQVVTELGTRVQPESQEIRVDGESLNIQRAAYYVVNKPKGVVSTSRDPDGRPRVTDLVPPELGRLFAVGRLDMSSEGLILLTNDGELANALTHPRYGVEKTYQVFVSGHPTQRVLDQLEKGVRLAEGWAKALSVKVKNRRKDSTVLEMVLDEGRNREIRRLLARVGHKVRKLVRVGVGPIRLGDMPAGSYRELTPPEVKELRKAARVGERKAQSSRARPPGKSPRRGRKSVSPAGKQQAGRGAKPTGRPRGKGNSQ
jgi:23S rRNA pseudouridine2605 synthase